MSAEALAAVVAGEYVEMSSLFQAIQAARIVRTLECANAEREAEWDIPS